MTATDTPPLVIEPGLVDLDEAVYHADTALDPQLGRSLSVTGAKKLLPPSTPAHFAWERDNPPPPRDVFDLGSAAHTLVLDSGPAITVLDYENWQTKAAREERDAVREAGVIPLLRKDYDAAVRMADAVMSHPLAAKILSEGEPEKAAYWIDPATGITCRARFDLLRDNAVVDLKTAADASPEGFAKAVANYGYHMQADWYSHGVEILTGEPRPFLFVVVEKDPPHAVAVYQLDDAALEVGRARNEYARQVYAECESSGVWPAYSPDIETLTLPRWAS